MKKKLFSSLMLSGLLVILLLGGTNQPVSASSYVAPISAQNTPLDGHGSSKKPAASGAWIKLETSITLAQLDPVGLGDSFTLSGELKDKYNRPVKEHSVLFTLNGKFLGQSKTDAYGLFERKFSKDLDAGTYPIVAYWNGTHDLAPTSTSATLEITPALVRVQTVPPVAGLPFSMADQRVISGKDGSAIIKINQAGAYPLTVLVDQYKSTTERIEFGRWLDESYVPSETITVPTDKTIQVGLNVFRQVGQSFVDLDGYPVDPKRVTEFMIRSAQGDVFIFHDGQPRWIPASRVARRVTGLEETKLLYSVISVTIDGSNVVNQSQQRFYTFPTENWPISVLLYSLRITAKDGLFGFPVGKSVNIEFPDGRLENYPLGSSGTVVIHSLARGNYFTELVGTVGLQNRTPVALSRNQDVNTSVITYLDLSVVSLLAALVALGLLLYGRPSLLYILRRGKLPVLPEPQWVLASASESVPPAGEQLYDYRNLRYENIKMFDDAEFKRSIGVERELFEKMLSFLQKELQAGGHQTKLSYADQLLLTIVYLREHPSKLEIAPAYGVSVGTVKRSIERVKDALIKSEEFNQTVANLFKPDQPLLATVLIDDDNSGNIGANRE